MTGRSRATRRGRRGGRSRPSSRGAPPCTSRRRRRRDARSGACCIQLERAPRDREQERERAPEAARLRRVVAALPVGILADQVHRHLPPHPVPSGDRRRKARERQERVHEVRVRLAPHPRVHPAHRGPDHEPQMRHAEALRQEPVLRLHHVVVRVARESSPSGRRSASRSRRGPMPSGITMKIARRVERLARPEEDARERRTEELRRRAARPVQDEDGVRRASRGCRRASGRT